ncbi:MAG: (d)CMP kinase [Candidatus Omnitrophica bacterium]|nr:(d)CMP kinase [Candidatus Omnitrophota bacterium]MBU1924436.1 (d)CMP kinase [Candidatus Omnitrophota bacterium]
MVITIDGPAGAGKSTVAKLVAARLNFLYVDTGAMYRALTLKAMRENADLQDVHELVNLARRTKIILRQASCGIKVFLDGKDVSSEIRDPQLTNNVFKIASIPEIRQIMVDWQREYGYKHDIVIEGRDIGTVVFPRARQKFYLDADIEIRAKRRHKELQEKGVNSNFQAVLNQIQDRDYKDKTRSCGPLKQAQDASYINTSLLDIEGVVSKILGCIPAKQKNNFYIFCRLMLFIFFKTFFFFSVTGKKNVLSDGGCVIASNHSSFLDPVVLTIATDRILNFMAKEDLFTGNRFFNWLIRSLNAFPVKRDRADVGAIRLAVEKLKRGDVLIMFPEGTRSRNGQIKDAQVGIAVVAAKAGVPVIPAFISGTDRALPVKAKIPVPFIPVKVVFGSPLWFKQNERGADARIQHQDFADKIVASIKELSREKKSCK